MFVFNAKLESKESKIKTKSDKLVDKSKIKHLKELALWNKFTNDFDDLNEEIFNQ